VLSAQAQALAEGFALGAYGFTRYRSEAKPNRLRRVTVVGGGGARVKAALDRGARVAQAVALARDLVNEPGGALTPAAFADAATAAAEENGLTIKVHTEKQLAKAGFAGLIAVNRGSTQPARFVELTYEPAGSTRPRGTVALVGKGITFDSGGLSLKPADGMLWMKGDMGGAAAVLGAMSALRDLDVRARVRGFLPITDNMPGGDAQRVGDVIRYRNGKTAEVRNTDAEGRLILADALALASEEQPDAIVDLATLTGACMVGLGPHYAGLMGNHEGWMDQVKAAADRAGEPLWPLPLPDAYQRHIESKVADLSNIGSIRYGGAMHAGLFLKAFVGEGIPWAHLDIAGPAFNEGDDDGDVPSGGTGYGVRTLLELLRTFKRP
jgi:leucyl aminopeptidase